MTNSLEFDVSRSPKVSLVIPCFNGAQTIETCLESALAQTLPFFEIILVDNNSHDQSRELASRFSGVILLTCSEQSAAASRNMGWRSAQGELVAFMDVDVMLDRNWNREMNKVFLDQHIVGAQSQIIPDTLKVQPGWFDRFRYLRKKLMTHGSWIELNPEQGQITLNAAACIYRREALIRLNGFEELLPRLEDTDLALKAQILGRLTSSSRAIASVYYTGTFMSYLVRNFKNGAAQAIFNQLWSLKDTKWRVVWVKEFPVFSLLNYLFLRAGSIWGKLSAKTLSPKSLNTAKLLYRLKAHQT